MVLLLYFKMNNYTVKWGIMAVTRPCQLIQASHPRTSTTPNPKNPSKKKIHPIEKIGQYPWTFDLQCLSLTKLLLCVVCPLGEL